MDPDPLADFRRERWQRNMMNSPETDNTGGTLTEHEALKKAIDALNQVPNHRLRSDEYASTYKLIPDLEKAYRTSAERAKLAETAPEPPVNQKVATMAPRILNILDLCEDVLSESGDNARSDLALRNIREIKENIGYTLQPGRETGQPIQGSESQEMPEKSSEIDIEPER